ncbi:GGDEF domain-containing protein [Cognatilysobacter segetis]|uniref:GGDEF domain-containing protein n=1 Tax=Cognatilysobacter segetis TaxID=2492394 RepID=UPI00105BE36E|nr:GGDEF domain-containing protein [Lysobacter segetis]
MKASALVLLLVMPAVAIAGERVDDVLRDQRQHGFRSAAEAIERLEAASDRPGSSAPLAQRERYHVAIATLAVSSRQPGMVAAASRALAELDAMARAERCRPCAIDATLLRAQDALTRRDPDEAERLLRDVEAALPASSADVAQTFRYAQARLYNIRGNFAAGIAEALASSDLAEKAGDEAGRLRAQALLVAMTTSLSDYGRAETIARRAYADARRIGFTYAMASLRLNEANALGRAGKSALQAAALDEALRLSRGQRGMEEFEAVSLSNLADHWLMEHDYARALDYAQQAERLAAASGDSRSRSYALTNAGVATAHLGDVEGGLRMVREAVDIAEHLHAGGDVIGMTGELVGIYKLAGRYREALEALETVASLQQELTRQERDKTLVEMQERYDAQARQRAIDRLAAANRIKQAELSARTWQQRLWAALAVMLALAVVPLVRWMKRVRTDNRRLSDDVAVLSEQSMVDPLTGAANRRWCEAAMARHRGAPVGLMLLDIDFFKRVNDTWGHAAGDRVLVEVATRLRALLRQHDSVVRWGGEEFALILPDVGADALSALADRVMQCIAGRPIDIGGQAVGISVSIGAVMSPLRPGVEWQHAMHVADLALYMSKGGGRNCATCVLEVAPDTDVAGLVHDLASASARGEVRLEMVDGPTPARMPATTPA